MANTQKIFRVCGVVTTEFFILHMSETVKRLRKRKFLTQVPICSGNPSLRFSGTEQRTRLLVCVCVEQRNS